MTWHLNKGYLLTYYTTELRPFKSPALQLYISLIKIYN